MQNLKKHNKRKNTLFVNTIVLTVLVKMSFFPAFFIFAVFFNFHFQRCFDWFSKNQKIPKNQSKQNKKQEQKEDKDAKPKQMKYHDSKQSKTTSRTT